MYGKETELMKICVLSDSHYKVGDPTFVFDYLRNHKFDYIVHAGDIGAIDFYNEIMACASTYCVAGNCDNAYNEQYFGTRQTLPLQKIKLGLIHGHQGTGETPVERLQKIFRYDNVDVVVFGHTHEPFNEVIDGVLYFNPGSCSAKEEKPSLGILEVNGTDIKGEIVYLQK